MKYDIITVTYNSSRWLEKYFAAFEKLDYNKDDIRLVIVDNSSQDETVAKCREYAAISTLGEVKVIESGGNIGFGAGNNLGVKNGGSPFVFLLNVDTEIYSDAFTQIDRYIENAAEDAVAFEMRQLPVEMGKHYDPVTLETSWASGAAVVIRRTAYEAIGGFDENIFMYADDIDISWRLRANGGKLLYCPLATVLHHGWQKSDGGRFEYIHSAYAKLLIAYKYGDMRLIISQNKEFLKTLRYPRHFPGVRKELLKLYIKHFMQIPAFIGFRKKHSALFNARVYDFRPGFAPDRGQIVAEVDISCSPLVSVVIRTHKRKEVLRRTLMCLRNQIYKNFEVVIVEDGENTAEEMVKSDFADLNINYHSTGVNVGRGRAGNIGIERAKGEFVSFLDDDDFYYADFISGHVAKFMEHPQADVVISGIMAVKSDTLSIDPFQFEYKGMYSVLFDHITLMDMCVKCRIPMTGAMFRRDMYEKYGGMREDIDADEDWCMWLKYITNGNRINPYNADINRAMSMFLYPANEAMAKAREERYRVYDKIMLYDESLVFDVHGSEIRKWEEFVSADINHLRNIGALPQFLADLKPLGVEKLEYNPESINKISAKQINNYYYWLVEEFSK